MIKCFSFFCWAIYITLNVPDVFAGTVDAGHGKVIMPGSIIDSACSISVASRNQTIELPTGSINELDQTGYGKDKLLEIKLIDCSVTKSDGNTEWKGVYLTFLGETVANTNSLFALHGDLQGIGIQIRDVNDNVMISGRQHYAEPVKNGTTVLKYKIRLMTYASEIGSGSGSATIKFRLTYD